jgi:hypothetical protein
MSLDEALTEGCCGHVSGPHSLQDAYLVARLQRRRATRVADRVMTELAIVHGFAHRLLVLQLPDQLTLGFMEGARDVAVVGDCNQRRETRQGGP